MECLKLIYVSKQDMYVPCGRCAFCAATRRSDWALRLYYEGKLHYGSKFVTLTYADHELSWNYGHPQLVKRDLQNFFKRLRKAGHSCRYYAVGEYGAKTLRPHYHILLYGDVPELAIRRAWAHYNKRTKKFYAIGQVHIGSVTQESIMYCLGYMVNGKSWRMRHKRVPPFSVMSRGGKYGKGLGANYLTKAMVAWHRSGRKNYVLLDGAKRHLPRYYKCQIFSKLDQVRIAVKSEKEQFRRMLCFIRGPVGGKMKDPMAYYESQRQRLARSIRFKSKDNLTI